MKRIDFVNDEYYHIYNRGVDKRNIFPDQRDYVRFLKGLRLFNASGMTWLSLLNDKVEQYEKGKRLVDVLCYCLMPNHYHILIKQKSDSGITTFMRKLNTGYTMYFNIRYKRTGRLFENKFKAVHVKNDDFLRHLSRYIHMNPLDLTGEDWRNGKILKTKTALKYLRNYPWSSLASYVSVKTRNRIINKGILAEIFSNKTYNNFVIDWMNRAFDNIEQLTLE